MKLLKSLFVYHCMILKFTNVLCDLKKNSSTEFNLNGFSITNFISSFGYDVEAHTNIETEDGYLLTMFRIPQGKNNDTNSTRPPVLLMHGLLGSAENFVISGPDSALAFYLADIGYDVWLGNARGNAHSRKHKILNPNTDKVYWKFSWHEVGIYDLPAKIDYILEETNQTDLYYIGHSQGTTSFFVMASERPSYNTYIRFMVALAPAAFMSHVPQPALRLTSNFIPTLNMISDLLGVNEFTINSNLLKLAGQAVCQNRAVIRELCANIIFLSAGYDSDQLDRSIVPLIIQTAPAGASTRQLFHYGQEIASGEFRQFDYGSMKNYAIYGTSTPPSYDLSKITAPVALIYAANDWMVSFEDVKLLADKLPNLVMLYQVPYAAFNHLDFIFAKDAVKLLYSKVNEEMEKYL